jgi:hypothetical protein
MSAAVTLRRVPAWAETCEAVLEGPAGTEHLRRCIVCFGRLVVGDRVYVTVTRLEVDGREIELLHAMSHAPDCVKALEREAREGR